jgi:hypothetical protein
MLYMHHVYVGQKNVKDICLSKMPLVHEGLTVYCRVIQLH